MQHNYDGNALAEREYAARVAELGDDERKLCGWCDSGRVCVDGKDHCEAEPCAACSADVKWRDSVNEEDVAEAAQVDNAIATIVNLDSDAWVAKVEAVQRETGRKVTIKVSLGTGIFSGLREVEFPPRMFHDLCVQFSDVLDGGKEN